MAFSTTTADAILKTRYLGPIRDQINNATILFSKIMKQDAIAVSGKNFTVPLHTARNEAAGVGRAESGTLPTAGQQAYDTAVVPVKRQYGRIQITGPVIRAARDDAGAFVTAIESEIKGVTKDTKRSMNRQFHSDGRDALAFWTAADDISGTNVDDNQGNAFVHLPAAGTMTCDLIDATDDATVLGNDIVVTLGTKAATAYAITWTGTVSGSADGDYLVQYDTLGQQLMGLAGIVSDVNPPLLAGGLHGLPVATKPFWKAQVFAAAGVKRDLTLSLMQEPLSAIFANSDYDESDVAFLLANTFLRDKYYQLLIASKMFVNTLELDGGFKGIDFSGHALVADPQCRRNRLYYIVPDTMRIFRLSDFDWLDRDGAVLSRVSNQDAYEATLFFYGDLGCVARNGNAVLDDIID